MDRRTFKQHLKKATIFLIEFTKGYCYNDFPDDYMYIIIPNVRKIDKHLTLRERKILKEWNKYEDHPININQTIDLLHHDNEVPTWINMSVHETNSNFTIIDLVCSRRLRTDNDLYHQGEIMPFHIQVPIPFEYDSNTREEKFDINWQNKILK